MFCPISALKQVDKGAITWECFKMTKRIILAAVAALITTPALAADPYTDCSGLFSALSDETQDQVLFEDFAHYESAFKNLAYEMSGEERSDDSDVQAAINTKRRALREDFKNGSSIESHADAIAACVTEGMLHGIVAPSAEVEVEPTDVPKPVR